MHNTTNKIDTPFGLYLINANSNLKKVLLILLGSWTIALSAQFYIPTTPIPTTMQTFSVILIGALLGRKLGLAAVIAYIIQGLFGLPFFSGGVAGLAVFKLSSLGYIVGFIPAVYFAGFFADKGYSKKLTIYLPLILVAQHIMFLFGVAWLAYLLNWDIIKAISLGYVPFILIDTLKFILLALILSLGWKIVK